MAHSLKEFGGEKVGKFVMSVIEAVSNAKSSNGSGGGAAAGRRGGIKISHVSPYPIPMSPSSPTTSKSQSQSSSQELVEDALGSLTTLFSVSSSTVYLRGSDGVVKVVGSTVSGSNGGGKVHTRRKDTNPPRKNILRRKKSSLKALSPEDLGRVSKSPLQLDALSPLPPSLIVTFPSSSSTGSSHYEKNSNDKGEKVKTATSLPKYVDEHPSTFHLRKPISNYTNNKTCNDTSNGDSKNGKNTNNSNNNGKQENKIKVDSVNCGTSGGSGSSSTFKDITKKVVGQRSANCTTCSINNPESLLLLHNGKNNNSNSSGGVVSSSQDSPVPVTNKLQHGNENNTDLLQQATNLEEDCKERQRQQELGNLDHENGCHGHMCVHHYHHHSHHHHYHYYEKSSCSSANGQRNSDDGHYRPAYHDNHTAFSINNNNPNAGDDQNHHNSQQLHQQQHKQQNDTVEESDINYCTVSISPQHKQQHYLHNHHTKMLIKNNAHISRPAEKSPKSPPPRHEYSLDDISFYRKFSATSPLPNIANRRSKSSLEWPVATDTKFSMLFSSSGGEGGGKQKLRSNSKRQQKSRSTPIRLDLIGSDSKIPHSSTVASPKMAKAEIYQYGCKCGGCHFCCNEFSCNCCCDECCCARQCKHVSSTPVMDNVAEASAKSTENDTVGKSKEEQCTTPLRKGTINILNGRSRSVDSILSLYNNGNNKIATDDEDDDDDEDEVMNDPDSFIDNHLLRHLELYDTDDNFDDEETYEERKQEDDLSTKNNSDHDDEDDDGEKNSTGQLQLISIDRKEPGATGRDHQQDTNGYDENGENNATRLVVVGNIRDGSGASRTTAAELISPRRSTSIVIVRKTPTRSSSIHRRSTGNDCGVVVSTNGNRRRRSANTNSVVLRTANGEIRSSPIVPFLENSNEARNTTTTSAATTVVIEEQARRSAMMTVTVDSMSLFLDAVHLQMNQG